MSVRRMLILIALLAASFAGGRAASAQTVRGLFVGIDSYAYSETAGFAGAGFKDLRGAVGDAIRFKNRLRSTYALRLDTTPPGTCPSAGPLDARTISISLYNQCATRSAIMSALDELIATSKPKDTILFYFAGHGAQYADDSRQDQASGYHGTILPHDARAPNAPANGEIFDYELKAVKERAVARGVYFVTIFDSCNSGTATRDLSIDGGRSAPTLTAAPPPRAIARATEGDVGGGYWVHFGAALDGQLAREAVEKDGKPAGIFTSTLIETMGAMPRAAFGDIIRDVQARLIAANFTKQTPMAEGELRAAFGAAPGEGIAFPATWAGGQLSMAAGRLSGVTSGSTYALFRPEDNGLGGSGTPVAVARVTKVEDFSAALTLQAKPPATMPERLVAVEKMRDYGVLSFAVANRMTVAAERKAVDTALKGVPFVGKGTEPPVSIAPAPGAAGRAVLRARDDSLIADLGAVADAGFAERLTEKLKKVWRVQQLLMLGVGSRADGIGIRFCIGAAKLRENGADVANTVRGVGADCPAGTPRALPTIPRERDNLIAIENKGAKPRFLYVLGIDPAYGVSLIHPASGGQDSRLAPNMPIGNPDDPVRLMLAGTYHFVTIATEEPISAAALEQQGANTRGTACASALEQLLCNAQSGTRDAAAPRVGNWSALVTSVIVK